jgi:hypothetical protein
MVITEANERQGQMYRLECTPQQSWVAVLKANCNSFFQTALLLSADPKIAEAAVVAVVGELDMLFPPNEEDIGELHKTVAVNTIRRLGSQDSINTSQAQSILQRGLWPLLEVEQFPRICFVLGKLLGFAMSSCAQILGVEEVDVRALLQLALVQLCHASQNDYPQVNETESRAALAE